MVRRGFKFSFADGTDPDNLAVEVEEQAAVAFSNTTGTYGRMAQMLSVTDFTTAGNFAITAAAIAGGIITRDPNGGARTDTLPTGATIETAIPGLPVGAVFSCYYINTANGAEVITFAVNTGVTINNVGQTLGRDTSGLLLFRKTAVDTFVCYILGGKA